MYALKHRIVIPASRHVEIDLPASAPEGPAELIVLCPTASDPRPPPEAALEPIWADMPEEEWDAFQKAMTEARKADRLRDDDR